MAAQSRKPSLAVIIDRLKSRALRMTKKRHCILQVLMTFDRPVSADEIRQEAQLPESDLVTVYRNLDAFEKAGVLQRVPLENGTHLFELTAPDEHYHHLVCRQCHYTERFDYCLEEKVMRKAKTRGFSQIGHILEIYGLCPNCAK